MMRSDHNIEANRTPVTRRSKRKADDVEKQSPASSKKRLSSKSACATGATTARSNPCSSVGKRRSKAPQKKVTSSAAIKKNLSEKEKQRMSSLLQKANLDQSLLSAITSQMNSNVEKSSELGDDDLQANEDEERSPIQKQNSTRHRVKPSRTVSTRNSLPDSTDEEDDVHHEYQDELQDDNEGSSEVQDDEEGCDHDELRDGSGDANVPNIGDSDEEQDVSFHDAGLTSSRKLASPVPQAENETSDIQTPTIRVDIDQESVEKEVENPSDQVAGTFNVANLSGVGSGSNERFPVVDETVLLNIAQVLKATISSEMNNLLSQLQTEMRKDRDLIQNLREHTSELTSMITTMATTIFIRQTASHPRGKELQRKLCLLPAIFNDQVMLKILPRVVVGFFVNSIHSGSQYSVLERNGVDFFSTLYFSIQAKEKKKEKYASEVGKIYSKFRYSLLTSSILAMQKNTFQTFRTERNSAGDPTGPIRPETYSDVCSSVSALTQPFWLKHGYVLEEHCKTAINKQEKRSGSDGSDESQTVGESMSQQTCDNESLDMQDSSASSERQKVSRNGPLTHDEIATEVAAMVYRIFTAMLYKSRTSSKVQLFNDVLYVFSGWMRHSPPVEQSTLKIKWEKERTTEADYVDDLPRTKLVRPLDRLADLGQDTAKIHIDNIRHLETVISQHPELCLIVQHDVIVNGTATLLRYRISLIEVSCRLIASYTTLESSAKVQNALCTDRRCLKAIVVTAIGLRKLMEKAVYDLQSENTVLWSNNNVTNGTKGKKGRPKRTCVTQTEISGANVTMNEYKFANVNGMSIDQLYPSPSKQKEILNNMILTLTEEEFMARMLKDNEGREQLLRENSNFAAGNDGDARIRVDEGEGVFDF